MDHPHFPVVVNQLNQELMKEILQTNELKPQTACVEHLFMFCSCIAHVEHVGQDLVAAEEEETEEVCQEEEQQQFVESNQAEEQYLDTDFANPDLQQGKHQIHFKPVSYIYLSYTFT